MKRDDVYVPQVIQEFTTKRILVMEWIDGIKITEKQLLENKVLMLKKL